MRNVPYLSCLITFSLVVLYYLFGAQPTELMWQAQQSGLQPWRLISAHFVHISVDHLLWNALAFIGIGAIVESYSTKRLIIGLLLGVVAVSGYLECFSTLEAYAGLSGVLNTLLVVALYELQKSPGYYWAATITLGLSLLKIVLELVLGNALFSSLVWPPAPQAHLAGWVAGLLLAWYFKTFGDKTSY